MVIEKVHGLQATSMSLNDRFTLLASMEPVRAAPRPRRRSVGSLVNHNNRALIEQIARHLERESKRLTMRQRLGGPSNLRRFGSESSLPGLFRSNSFSNLSQQSIKNRVAWRQSNNNLSRAGALNGMAGAWRSRGVRRRGAARGQRLRMRGARLINGRVSRVQRAQRGAARPGMRPNGARPQTARRGTAFRGRGRGGITRNQQPKVVPSKEELDAQLDQYMAGTKAALDRELDTYMKNAMELE